MIYFLHVDLCKSNRESPLVENHIIYNSCDCDLTDVDVLLANIIIIIVTFDTCSTCFYTLLTLILLKVYVM